MTDNTSLGDRMKMYEKAYSKKAMPLIPTIARLDGKAFHSWTRGLDKPFDHDFIEIMQNVTKKLVEETNAVIGYTQSDEITLIFYSNSIDSQIFFDGKLNKMTSVLASMCTAYFNEYVVYQAFTHNSVFAEEPKNYPKFNLLRQKPLAFFDCRVFQVPTKEEVVNCLVWREQDAVRNSIQSAGQANFSHKELHGKSCDQIQEMLFVKRNINWNDYKSFEKRGTYFKKVLVERPFTPEELTHISDKHEAHKNPDMLIKRSDVKIIDYPILTKITNRVEVIFDDEEPVKEL